MIIEMSQTKLKIVEGNIGREPKPMTTVYPDGYDGQVKQDLNIPQFGQKLVTAKTRHIAFMFAVEKISGFNKI